MQREGEFFRPVKYWHWSPCASDVQGNSFFSYDSMVSLQNIIASLIVAANKSNEQERNRFRNKMRIVSI